MSSIIASIKQAIMWYNNLLVKRPLSTSMISAAAIFGGGDWLCQYAFPRVPLEEG